MTIPKRWYGFDIVRSIFLIAVIHFHSHEAFFLVKSQVFSASSSISPWLEPYSRSLAFGGQVLVLLFSFLSGVKHKSQKFLWIFLSVAILTLAVVEGRPFLQDFYYEWDIYSYLLVCVFVVDILGKSKFGNIVLLSCGLIILLIPWWNYFPVYDSWFFDAFIGACPPEGSASWPLLPWGGLFFASYATGYFVATERAWLRTLAKTSIAEVVAWVVVLLSTIPFWGAYYNVPLNNGFYCYVLRKTDFEFFVHIIWVIAALRFSLVVSINAFLGRSSFVRWLSNLRWNSSFGLCYLIHFLFLGAGSLLKDTFLKHPRVFDVYFIGLIVATEFIVRGIVLLRRRWSGPVLAVK